MTLLIVFPDIMKVIYGSIRWKMYPHSSGVVAKFASYDLLWAVCLKNPAKSIPGAFVAEKFRWCV